MKQRVLWFFGLGQICLFVGLAICIAIKPAGLGADNGISYYGTFRLTFVPYALSLLGGAIFSLLVARQIHQPSLWPLRFGLMVFALMAAVLTFTPYSAGALLDWTHTIAGIILFTLQLILSGWLIVELKYKFWAVVLAVIELVAGVVSAIYVLPKHGFLIQSQVIFQLAFGGLVFYSLRNLASEKQIAMVSAG